MLYYIFLEFFLPHLCISFIHFAFHVVLDGSVTLLIGPRCVASSLCALRASAGQTLPASPARSACCASQLAGQTPPSPVPSPHMPRVPIRSCTTHRSRVPSACRGPCRGLCRRRGPHRRPPRHSVVSSSTSASNSVSMSLHFRPTYKENGP